MGTTDSATTKAKEYADSRVTNPSNDTFLSTRKVINALLSESYEQGYADCISDYGGADPQKYRDLATAMESVLYIAEKLWKNENTSTHPVLYAAHEILQSINEK